MSKEVKNKISLDASQFQRGTAQVKRDIKALEKGLTIDMAKAAKMGAAAFLAVGAGLTAVGIGLAKGISGVIDLGGRLSDLSGRTGIAVNELLILEQVFKDNGLEAEKVGPSMSKMAKGIYEASQGTGAAADAFAALGLSAEKLIMMTPAEQFKAIGAAIAAIENPTQRAALAMEVFGKSGAELINTFGSGPMEDAAGSIGAQAALLAKNAALFDRTGDLLARTGNKLQGFFVGIADKVVPVILPLLEQLDKLDLAGQGQKFGDSLATGLRVLIGAFQNNQLGELFAVSLKIAAAEFVNAVARGWLGILNGFFKAFIAGWTSSLTMFRDGLVGAAQAFATVILDAVAGALSLIPGAGKASEGVKAKADDMAAKASANFASAAKAVTGVGGAMRDAFENGMADLDGFKLIDTGDLNAQAKAIADAALAAIPAIGAGAAALLVPKPNAPTAEPTDAAGAIDSSRNALFGGVSSLAAIGGGGGVGGVESLVDQSQKQTGYLKSISGSIKSVEGSIKSVIGTIGGTRDAVFA